MKKQTNNSCDLVLLRLIALSLVGICIHPSYITLGAYLLLSFIVIVMNPTLGYCIWIMSYSFYYTLGDVLNFQPHYIFFGLMFFSMLMQLFRDKLNKLSSGLIMFFLSFIVIAAISTLTSRDISYSIAPLMLVIQIAVLFILVESTLKSDKKIFRLFNYSMLLAVIATFVVLLINGDILGAGRIGIGGNVKKVANIVTPTILILTLQMYDKKSMYYPEKYSLPKLGVFLISSILLLIFTVSRGPILAIAISIIFVLLIHRNRIFNKKDYIKFVIVIALFILVIALLLPFINSSITNNELERLYKDKWSENPRWDIWLGALSELEGSEFLWGAGLGLYQTLELISGHNYYAHSVYFDTLVTAGSIELLLLISFLGYHFRLIIKNKNLYGTGILTLIIVTYSTHGSMTGSQEFWVMCACVVASNQIDWKE
ncbi:O-antigen ligase family protein [Acidaminobacter sp. JC074]|uniref:O-antigen ligase family protein n=1 Tax=Acidaminobacter sp. JC074 TaxID=2530199 RepID=UPI001F0E6F6F|nr:O-antigen ligase family protein [Acidaminobacter sp. JC074]MCH4890652.1 O-antigen ligase family protein [Acidaminobacter sp. JC074]